MTRQKKQIVLEAKDFHAITGPKTKIYYDRDMDALHNFFAKGGDAPVWTFDVPESGEYSITILYSAHRNLARDKKNDIHLDGKPVLSFATQATKGASQDPWYNFEDHVVGKMSMEKGRRNSGHCTATQTGWTEYVHQTHHINQSRVVSPFEQKTAVCIQIWLEFSFPDSISHGVRI